MRMRLFLDSSVFISALISNTGASAQILALCEARLLEIYISDEVEEEVFNVFDRKFPELKPLFNDLLKTVKLKRIKTAKDKISKEVASWIKDPKDVKILMGAKKAEVDYLVTLDKRHFIKDEKVSEKSGLTILTPGDFLNQFYSELRK